MLIWRIEAKLAYADLLRRSVLAEDPREARMALSMARASIARCDTGLLG